MKQCFALACSVLILWVLHSNLWLQQCEAQSSPNSPHEKLPRALRRFEQIATNPSLKALFANNNYETWYSAPLKSDTSEPRYALGGLDPCSLLADRKHTPAGSHGERYITAANIGEPKNSYRYKGAVFLSTSKRNKRHCKSLLDDGALIIAYRGWCAYGMAHPIHPHFAQPANAGYYFKRYFNKGRSSLVLTLNLSSRTVHWKLLGDKRYQNAEAFFENISDGLLSAPLDIRRVGIPIIAWP